MNVRLGTRGSDLALWQAHHVAGRLAPRADTEITIIKTKGDRIDDVPLTADLGKAFFTAEIEQALLDGRVDLAVHSHKDLATESPSELAIVAVPSRGPAGELLVIGTTHHDPDAPFLPLATGCTIGTSSPRRREQLAALRPDLRIEHLRGNVPTRVGKVRDGGLAAILVAEAGVHRLELDTTGMVTVSVPTSLIVPAPAQGALAIQTRAADEPVADVCREQLHDADTAAIIAAERSLLGRAGGGCQLPLGVHIVPGDGGYVATAFLGADQPTPGAVRRWASATGSTPAAAAEALWSLLVPGTPTGAGPMAGTSVILLGTSSGGTQTGRQLESLGMSVTHVPVLDVEPLDAPELANGVSELRPGDVLVVTSRHAASRLEGLTPGPGVRVAAVGAATASALEAAGLSVDVVGPGDAARLAADLDIEAGASALFPCGSDALPELPMTLAARGALVRAIIVYRTLARTDVPPLPAADARIYMSPSAVRACVALGFEAPTDTVRLGIGLTTEHVLTEAGLSPRPLVAAGLAATLLPPLRTEPAP